ncbi:MAG TPA: methyltransferase domain-containing protein [Solirubrobacteraceae bacterium]|nr:methyltransferase domain-containing protein [Solirubrobacteraceae bacterium]
MSEEIVDRWSGAAQRWRVHADQIDEENAPVTDWLLAAAAPAPGESALDVGAGPGGVGLQAARAVAPGGRVVLSDLAPAMLDVARERARERDLRNVEFEVADATALPWPDASFDVVLARFAFQAMDDPARALAEALRVLRPGGRLALAVWGPPEGNPWAALSMQALREAAGSPEPASGEPGMYALCDEERLRSLLTGAGFAAVRLEHVTDERRFDSFEQWWQLRRDLPPGSAQNWASLDAGAREAVERALRERVQPYGGVGGGLAFASDALVALARRPGG